MCLEKWHTSPSPFHQARSVPQGKKKTVFDAWNGTVTFISPLGRYRYKTALQGYFAYISEISTKTKYVDDVLLVSDSIEESFFLTLQWLDIYGRHGITLNSDKLCFEEDTIEFDGFEINPDTVRLCADI